ncbi:MAG: PilN domain-containing protein, partial [Actinomycetota bacterium]
LRQQVAEGEALATTLLNGQVLWSDALRDVSASLPGGLWLTSMNAQLSPTTPGAPSTGPVLGTIQFQGEAFQHTTVGDWLTRLEQVPGWVNAWVSSSTRGESQDAPGKGKVVTFSVSVDLSSPALTHGRQL